MCQEPKAPGRSQHALLLAEELSKALDIDHRLVVLVVEEGHCGVGIGERLGRQADILHLYLVTMLDAYHEEGIVYMRVRVESC